MKLALPSAAFLVLAAAGIALPQAAAQTLVHDTFADGNRTTQSLPSSVAWYLFGNTGYAGTVSGGAFQITPATGSSIATIGYFASTPMSVGQTLTLSFSLSYATESTTNASFRFGLFNSGGSQIGGDLTSASNSAFTNATGYAVDYELDPTPAADGYQIASRTAANSTFWTAGAFTGTTALNGGTSANTSYPVTLTLQYVSASQMTVTSSINGVTDTHNFSTPVTTFDSLSFFDSGANGAITLSNIQVSLASVPEPSLLLPFGLLGLLGLGLRHRGAGLRA